MLSKRFVILFAIFAASCAKPSLLNRVSGPNIEYCVYYHSELSSVCVKDINGVDEFYVKNLENMDTNTVIEPHEFEKLLNFCAEP